MNTEKNTALNQFDLDFGPSEHIQLIHGEHESHIALIVHSDNWNERTYNPFDALVEADKMAEIVNADIYIGQNGICPFRSRSVSSVTHLNTCFVDLDTYKIPSLIGLPYRERLDAILHNASDLPLPTLAADSGRGIYLIWALKEPFYLGTNKSSSSPSSEFRRRFLAKWQRVEDLLIQRLSNFGADPKARDAARVLRLAGTINQKNGHVVSYTQLSKPILFSDLETPLLKWYEQNTPAQINRSTVQCNRTSNQSGVSSLLNSRTLAAARMDDLKSLCILRGGLSDYRGRALFIYAQAASYFCHDEESLISECQQFASEFFIDVHGKYRPERIAGLIGSLVERFKQNRQRMGKHELDIRYKLTNARIILDLSITEDEQMKLVTIIGKDEKRRRNTASKRIKRRANGVIPAEQYKQNRKLIQLDRRKQANLMAVQGCNRKQIAEKLKVTVRTVVSLLKVSVSE